VKSNEKAKSNKADVEIEYPAGKKIAHDDDYSGAHRVPHNLVSEDFQVSIYCIQYFMLR
jgi:hypothetical protein